MRAIAPDIKRGRLSRQEKDTIEKLFDDGVTTGQIAQRLNRHPSTVGFAVTLLGLRPPAQRVFAYKRNGRDVRSFGPDEDAFILALRTQGFTWTKIAEITGRRTGHARSAATIGTRLRMLANREEHL